MSRGEFWEREELAERRAPGHPVVRAYTLPKIKEICRYIKITKDTLLLDVGCGNGSFMFYFDKFCNIYGIDRSYTMLKMNPVRKVLNMDAGCLAFKDNSFDVVFCNAFLHHVGNIDKVIGEMKRVSRKYVLMIEPNRNNPVMFLFSLVSKEEKAALKFSLSYLKDAAIKNGLKVLYSFSYGMITPNKTPEALLPILNRFNFKFPFGVSNFIIAVKP